MSVTGLNHVNLRAPADQLDALLAFYRDVLGLAVGPRPAFDSVGYWLYAGGQPVLHLSRRVEREPHRAYEEGRAKSTFDHFAFSAVDPARLAARLHEHHVHFREERSPVTRQHQFFLADPAGNDVELNFPYVDGPPA
jgi:catechol 2,3-dioxygenase-like lactoylglutathione lyase family enzyme